MSICRFCGKEFKKKGIHIHEMHCKMNPNYDLIDHTYLSNNAKQTNEKNKKRHLNSLKEYILTCENCGKKYTKYLSETNYTNKKYSKFCSSYCSHVRHLTQEQKDKISHTLQNKNIVKAKTRICLVCKKEYKHSKKYKTFSKTFCSKDCYDFYKKNRKLFLDPNSIVKLQEAGKKSASIQSNTRRSKNEMYFYDLIKQQFKNVDHNKPIFNGWDADVIIYDIKYAILWNGPWHYKQIKRKTSLQQIQNRDKIKIEEIKKRGFTPYIIKDMGKYNIEFVKDQYNIFIEYIKNKLIGIWQSATISHCRSK